MKNYSEDASRQYHIQVAKGEVGRYVIMPGDPKRCVKIAQYFDDPVLIADNREYITYTGYLGRCEGQCDLHRNRRPVRLHCNGRAGAAAALIPLSALEPAAECEPDVKGGDIVVATGAVRMEGTSREYAPIEYPAVARFGRDKRPGSCRKRTRDIPTTQAWYSARMPFTDSTSRRRMPVGYELLNKWEAWKRLGCLASEMESAALFVAAGKLRARAGSCFLVLAEPGKREAWTG